MSTSIPTRRRASPAKPRLRPDPVERLIAALDVRLNALPDAVERLKAIVQQLGEIGDAVTLEQAHAALTARRPTDPMCLPSLHIAHGVQAARRGDFDAELLHWHAAETVVRALKDRMSRAFFLSWFSAKLINRGRYVDGLGLCFEGLSLLRSGGQREAESRLLSNSAVACALLGQLERALWLAERSEQAHVQAGLLRTSSRAWNLVNLAGTTLLLQEERVRQQGAPDRDACLAALAHLAFAESLGTELKLATLAVEAAEGSARLFRLLGDVPRARRILRELIATVRIEVEHDYLSRVMPTAAGLALDDGDPAEALQLLAQAEVLSRREPADEVTMRYWETKSRVHAAVAEWEAAFTAQRRLADLLEQQQRRRAQDAGDLLARRVDQERTEALHFLSHDLRSPLSQILALAVDAPSPEALQRVGQIAGRALGLADRSLDYLRAMLFDGSDTRLVDWVDIAHEACAAQEAHAELRGVSVELQTADTAPVQGNHDLLQRCIANLIDNAVRHSPHGGCVRVSLLRESRATWCLSVADEGPGLDADQIEQLFQPMPSRSSGGGLGLGLAFVARAIDKHLGAVEATNGERGAVFMLRLPVPQSSGQSTDPR